MNSEKPEMPINGSLNSLMLHSPYDANSSTIVEKVREDILFLQDRIERIKALAAPNPTVLQTYQSMLESRKAVLQWLKDNGDLDEERSQQLG